MGQFALPIGLFQQQGTRIGGHGSAIKFCDYITLFLFGKVQGF